jgi:hypothetical protein
MSASYWLRLTIQCLNSFLLVHLLFRAILGLCTARLIRVSTVIPPRWGVWLILSARCLPLIGGLFAALALVAPSYLALEPAIQAEELSPLAIVFALCAVWVLSAPLIRAAKAMQQSAGLDFAGPEPRVAVAGLLRPRVLFSRAAVELLSNREFEAVMAHERAHQRSRDNLKRLALLCLPDVMPLVRGSDRLQRACWRLMEWAADDDAAAGDAARALDLAEALIIFARSGHSAHRYPLATSLIEDTDELAVRVNRLLRPRDAEFRPSQWLPVLLPTGFGALATVSLAALSVATTKLAMVHRALEILTR